VPSFCADEEWLPLREGQLDAVFSNLSLHWVNDLPGAMIQINRALKPDGLFLATLFGGETLRELRDCLAETEIALDGGLSPRTSPLTDVRDAGGLLNRAGFALPTVDTDVITVMYSDPLKLLRDLRGMGETNCVIERRRTPLRRETLMAALALYQQRHGDAEGRVPATFQVIYLTAWAPDASQPRPARRGSGQVSLGDILAKD
ncbi:MAG: methyltransferase domain-containing protein, partial [Rhodospirillaceae bacterium]